MNFEKAIESYKNYLTIKDKPQSVFKIMNRINNQIMPYFKNRDIYKISSIDYLNWQMQINSMNFKYSYKKTLHYCFVSFLNYCMKFHNLSENIASKVGNFKNIEVEECGKVWTEENQQIDLIDYDWLSEM